MPRGQVQDWRLKYRVVDPNTTEIIGASLWDRQTYVSATTTRLTFFSTIPANKRAGNLTIAGQLPSGTAFLVQVIRIILHVEPQATAAPAGALDPLTGMLQDCFLIYHNGAFSLDVLNKRYADYPAYMLPPGVGFAQTAFSAGAATSLAGVGSFGQPDPRATFKLAVPIAIPPQTNFPTVLEWPNGAVTLIGGNTDISVVLDGQLARPVQ